MDFEVLILGSDINAYYMARCTHEAYNKKAYLLANKKMAFTAYSSILNIIYNANLWDEKNFLQALEDFAKMHKKKKILLIASNETYAQFIVKNKSKINSQYVFNYPSLKTIKSLIDKEKFYKTYEESNLVFPKTIYYDIEQSKELKFDFEFPVILKPADVVSYGHIDFEGKNKIYKVETEAQLTEILNKIKISGYNKSLIIQEYIPGDDSYLFDSVVYSDKNGQVKLITFAQIGLQEHTKHMVGNAAVLINGFNSFDGDVNGIVDDIKNFMNTIKYKGFAEFDIKYDARDKKFKVLEINARQGRSSYYLTGLGYNLVEVLVKDLIMNESIDYCFLDKEIMLSFVPKYIIKNYVVNEDFKEKAIKLWESSNVIKPLFYKKERNLKRKIILYKRQFDYLKEYKYGYWSNR